MTAVERLRRVILAIAALTGVGLVMDLLLTGHTGSLVQASPFALVGVGLVAIAWPRRWMLRGATAVLLAGALFGVYEHLATNYAFEAEIAPESTTSERLVEAVQGASPLLAPGSVALMGLLLGAASLAPRRSR